MISHQRAIKYCMQRGKEVCVYYNYYCLYRTLKEIWERCCFSFLLFLSAFVCLSNLPTESERKRFFLPFPSPPSHFLPHLDASSTTQLLPPPPPPLLLFILQSLLIGLQTATTKKEATAQRWKRKKEGKRKRST